VAEVRCSFPVLRWWNADEFQRYRVLCELEGTVFRVYEPPKSGSTVKRVGEWWERRVGVGDSTIVAPLSTAVRSGNQSAQSGTSGQGQTELVQDPKLGDDQRGAAGQQQASPVQTESPQQENGSRIRSTRSLASTLLHPSRASRSSVDVSRDGPGLGHGRVPSSGTRSTSGNSSGFLSSPSSSGFTSATSRTSMSSRQSTTSPPMSAVSATSATSAASQSRLDLASEKSQAVPIPSKKDVIREYTTQNAESGLGSDYSKRKNVIRVRMEGEQFLLQAPDVGSVVDWIEVSMGRCVGRQLVLMYACVHRVSRQRRILHWI
jgi:hypothetical protein